MDLNECFVSIYNFLLEYHIIQNFIIISIPLFCFHFFMNFIRRFVSPLKDYEEIENSNFIENINNFDSKETLDNDFILSNKNFIKF